MYNDLSKDWPTVIKSVNDDSKLKITPHTFPGETIDEVYMMASAEIGSLQKKNDLSRFVGTNINYIQYSSYEYFLFKLSMTPNQDKLRHYYILRIKARLFPSMELKKDEDVNELEPKSKDTSFFIKWVPLTLPEAIKEKDREGKPIYTWKTFYSLFSIVRSLQDRTTSDIFYEIA